jgi:putative polyhydroxyalkanoate system protein
MSKIVVREEHNLSVTEARTRVGAFDDYMQKYGAKLVWKSESFADIKGMGVSGEIKNDPGAVTVTIKLGMMAKAIGVDPVKLESSVRKRIQATLAD